MTPEPAIFTAIGLLLFVGASGQVGADSAVCLAAGRDGRPDAGFGADPCGHHGHGGRLHGGALGAIYRHAPIAMDVVAVIGAATALFAATIGLAQNDIKKVFAYSTVSQLGYMFLGVRRRARSRRASST